MRPTVRTASSLLAAMSLTLLACGDDDVAEDPSAGTGSARTTAGSTADGGDVSGEITVYAAASLTEAFESIGARFEEANPGTTVVFNFAASSDLATQITEGAPADVFASADIANMDKLVDADGAAGEPEVFANNSLEIIVEPGNPQDIAGVEDLEDPELIVVTCDPEVPIGAYSQQVFERAGVTIEPDSLEEDVKAVANKVVIGEADAGIVYATDVNAAGDGAEGVEIPPELNMTAEYPIAVTAEAPSATGGEAFVDFVLGEEGQATLQVVGFTSP